MLTRVMLLVLLRWRWGCAGLRRTASTPIRVSMMNEDIQEGHGGDRAQEAGGERFGDCLEASRNRTSGKPAAQAPGGRGELKRGSMGGGTLDVLSDRGKFGLFAWRILQSGHCQCVSVCVCVQMATETFSSNEHDSGLSARPYVLGVPRALGGDIWGGPTPRLTCVGVGPEGS